ncbi:c-type cytochrome biogenesis protein CcmI [Sulfitobacter aestuarii]|uniref:C-type cytochrome biogenesis protein CcmI n=1 Tax=Sulfitobacter aestuarii TaxID=2161676 RepID=A0ABW5TYX6_9RHOB
MIFWAITLAMAVLVALLLARALRRDTGAQPVEAAEYDLKVYRDQLAEVERDLARGLLSQEDAQRARTEISRRILAADAAGQARMTAGGGPNRMLLALLVLVLVGGSLALYWQLGQPGYGDLALADRIERAEQARRNRPDQATAEAGMPATPGVSEAEASAQYLELLEKLRNTVAGRPDDLEGHRLLAQSEAGLGNFAAAARAQASVLRIRGEEAGVAELVDYAELLIQAAGGYVSPEAEAVLQEILTRERDNGVALYYAGLMMLQTGRPDVTLRYWDGLLRRGPEEAPWIAPIKAQIGGVAELAGVRYDLPSIGSGAARGPSAEDIANAAGMDATERMEMIGGMVAGLSDRLASEGGPPQDWARLITSLAVIGDSDQALAVYQNAMQVFAGEPDALDVIRAAGDRAGVAE